MIRTLLAFTIMGASAAADPLSDVAGDYVVVDLRRATGVSSPASPLPEDAIGSQVSVSKHGFQTRGLGCESWKTELLDDAGTLTEDPNLADAFPFHPEIGDRPASVAFRLLCEGEYFATFAQTDPRILVMTLANATVNAVLEKPLAPDAYQILEQRLADMKFLSGTPDAQEDAAADEAIRQYYAYRLRRGDMPLPLRPARSAALLTRLGLTADR